MIAIAIVKITRHILELSWSEIIELMILEMMSTDWWTKYSSKACST